MPDHKEKIQVAEALAFLKQYTASWDPSWCIQLVAIEPVGTNRKAKIEATSVALDDIDSLADFIVKWKHWGLYFGVNPLNQLLHIKAKKQHIAALAYYHLDFDPPKKVLSPAELAAWKVQARQQIADKKLPAPSALVDSGNGLGLFWRLAEPVLHDGGNTEALEAVNRALIVAMGGDKGTCNLDRVMRLPGTINRPNWRKLELERPVSATALLGQTDEVHKEGGFDFLPRATATSSKALSVPTDDLPPRFVELLAVDEDLRVRWAGNTDKLNDTSRNALDMSITSLLVRRGFNDAEIAAIHRAFPHGKVVQDGRGDDYIKPMLDKCRAQRILSRTEPWINAHRLIAERFTSGGGVRLLRHWNGSFYAYIGGAYRMLDVEDMKAKVWSYLGGARHYVKKTKTEPYKPNRARAGDVLGALEAVAHLDGNSPNPCWLDGAAGDDPADMLVLANGILHMPSRALQPHDPRLFTTTALPFAYATDADPPRAWLAFLNDLWGDDHESIETLQELFGYCLTTDCSQQKIMLVVGPKRGGKGTIARVLRALLGDANVVGPTLAGIATNFGLEPLIGKRLAIFSDVRISGRADQKSLADRLLSISGEDDLTIDRKYIGAWTGALKVRLLMFSNELPKFTDDSSALSSRFIVLRLVNSFFGKEDLGLADRLLAELPAILNWSLDGLARLKKRGAFRQPSSALELVREFEDLTSPVSSFLRDTCVVHPAAQVASKRLYLLWEAWCRNNGRDYPGTEASFGVALHAAIPQLCKARKGPRGERQAVYEGVGLFSEAKALLL